MTAPASEAGTSPTSRPRTPRRGPAELPFTFADQALATALADERDEPDWLRADRLAAAEAFAVLPTEANDLYTPYIDLRAAQLGSVRPYTRTAAGPIADEDMEPPADAAAVIELREDGVVRLVVGAEARAAGLVLETFGAALARDPDGLRADLEGGATLPGDDRFAALVRAFWSQGVRLVVPDGVTLARPILVRWAAGVPDRALLSRTLVRLGRGASASVVEELVPSEPRVAAPTATGEPVAQSLFHGTTEVLLGDGARLAFASIQEFGPGQIAFSHRHASIGTGAQIHWALAQLGGRLVRSRVDNRLVGDRSSVEQVEIVFGSDEQLFDLTSYTRHVGRDTTGNLLSKGALLDASRSYLKGLITIDRSAVGTDSFLGEFGMNLSRQARAVAIPSLEIDQPDCRRAAHSSAVGPIDEAQLFYLESRGIDADDARKFIVLGFLEPVVARVPLAATQDRLRELLEEKWSAGSAGTTAGDDSAAA